MLGANVGTTLIVQVLSFNVSAVAPVLFLIGVIAFKRGGQTRTRDLGRVAIGVGLMVLSLHILLDTLAPAENAPAVRTLLGAITGEPLLCLLMAAALTWIAHSSVTVVLLVMSLAYSHFITPVAALALILGANLGSAINPAGRGQPQRQSRQPPPAAGQSAQSPGRLRAGTAVPDTRSPTHSAASSPIPRAWPPISTPRSMSPWRWSSFCR